MWKNNYNYFGDIFQSFNNGYGELYRKKFEDIFDVQS